MPKTQEEVLVELTQLGTKLEKAAEDVREKGDKLMHEVTTVKEGSTKTTEKVDEALSKFGELKTQHTELMGKHGELVAQMTEIQQAIAARREDPGVNGKSMGELFVESAAFKEFKGKGNVRVQMSRKDIMNVTATVGSNTSQGNSLVSVTRVPGIVAPPERKLTIRDLLASGTTNSSMVEYAQETGFTNAAAVVTEGSTKPQSNLTFELKPAPVRTIAHYFKASRQILDDAPALQSYIDARARYGLRLTEEAELLNGDGTGAHIRGLIPSSTAYNAAFVVTAKQRMDTLRLAILQVYTANYPASGIVLHPMDWAAIQLTKDTQGRYIIGNPQDGNPATLWNLPVVESLSMTATTFLVGAFNIAAQIFDRMDIEVLLSTENDTDFIKNMVTILAEERLALAIYRPEAFVNGDFDTAT